MTTPTTSPAAPGQGSAGPSSKVPPVRKTQFGRVPPPSAAWQGVSWFAFALGAITFLYSVWYSEGTTVSDRYFLYCAVLFSWFGCLSVSKAVRDRQEGIPVTGLFYGLSFVAAIVPFVLVAFNLTYDSGMAEANRALIGMAYAISAYAVLAIAKNERDKQAAKQVPLDEMPAPAPRWS